MDVGRGLQAGARDLAAGETELQQGLAAVDGAQVARARGNLEAAEAAFAAARRRARQDAALQLLAAAPIARAQVDATARLAAIGEHLSAAGVAAAEIGVELVRLKARVAAAPSGADPGPLLAQALALLDRYQASAAAIGADLRAAHAERGQVDPVRLLPPLESAYGRADEALRQADQAFAAYTDVRRLLGQVLGLPLPS